MRLNKNKFASLFLCIVVFILQACATKPYEVRDEAAQQQELAYGKSAHTRAKAFFGYYSHDVLQGYVQRVGEQLAVLSQRGDLIFRFTVLDTSEVMVFSLPGGYVYVSRGLLVLLNNEAQLSAVLAHEIGHIVASHPVKKFMAVEQNGELMGEELAYFGYKNSAGGLFGNVRDVAKDGYGWHAELEAYKLAADYMVKAGYSPKALLDVYDLFSRPTKPGFLLQLDQVHGVEAHKSFLRKRLMDVVDDEVKSSQGTENDVIKRDERFLARLIDVVVDRAEILDLGTDNRLGVTFKMPRGWQTFSSENTIVMYKPDFDAYLKLSRYEKALSKNLLSELKALYSIDDGEVLDSGTEEAIKGWLTTKRATIYGETNSFLGVVKLNQDNAFLIEASAKQHQEWEEDAFSFQKVIKSTQLRSDNDDKSADSGIKLDLLVAKKRNRLNVLLSNSKAYKQADSEWIGYLNQMEATDFVMPGQYVKVTK